MVSIPRLASLLFGGVVALITATIFAIILRNYRSGADSVRELRLLLYYALGGGFSDYIIFDRIIGTGSLDYYMLGFSWTFLLLAGLTYFLWYRAG